MGIDIFINMYDFINLIECINVLNKISLSLDSLKMYEKKQYWKITLELIYFEENNTCWIDSQSDTQIGMLF